MAKQLSTQTRIERRFCAGELRAVEENKRPVRLVGYAAVFDAVSERMTGWKNDFVEVVAPGAFAKTLTDGDDVRATVDHKGGVLALGRTTKGTLRLSEDAKGLLADITPPDTQAGRDVVTLVKRGDLSQMSFSFETIRESIERAKEKGEPDRRILIEVKLFDVSIVTFPAYPDTTIAVRSIQTVAEASQPDITVLRRRLELAEIWT